MLLAMFLIMMSLMMMTQASCEADVLSCYYLDALNKTEAVLLVTIFLSIIIPISTPRWLSMTLSQCLKPRSPRSCVEPLLCRRTFHIGSENLNPDAAILFSSCVFVWKTDFLAAVFSNAYSSLSCTRSGSTITESRKMTRSRNKT